MATAAAPYIPPEERSTAQLIQDFEWDINVDPHGFSARYGRSEAKRELVRHGRDALPEIEQHLREHPPTNKNDLDSAWRFLQQEINKSAP